MKKPTIHLNDLSINTINANCTRQSFSKTILLIALFWLPGFSHNYLRAQCHPDFNALIALYNATNGSGWANNTGWAAGAAGMNCDVCSWHGVTCSAGRVGSIQLNGNNLTGTIPTEIGNFSQVWDLDLGNNHLSGTIPSSIGNLNLLVNLNLEGNQLSGSIPNEIGNLTNLFALSLQFNQISGPIPPELGNLPDIAVIALGYNQLSGSIPPELGNLSNLLILELIYNQLTGCFPQELVTFCPPIAFFAGNPGLPGGGNFAAFCSTGAGSCHDDDHDGIDNEYEIACGSNPLNNLSTCEVCDGIDNDLDGLTDDADFPVSGQATWYADSDGDGYGNASSHVTACIQPTGYVSDNSDCNDSNGAINPLANEECNGIDDNCDGNIPANEADNDGDGYRICQNDCNDNNAAIHPEANELCNNAIDDDCDGLINEGCGAALVVNAGTCQVVYYGYTPFACTTLSATVSGGITPYSYSWSNGSTSSSISVCPTTTIVYSVTVTDHVGTTAVNGVTVEVVDVHCGNNDDKVLVCHNPNSNANTLCVAESAVSTHLEHGDYLGACGTSSPCSGGQNQSLVIHEFDSALDASRNSLSKEYIHTEEEEVLFMVIPNPASDYIEVQTNLFPGIIKLIDINGQVIFRQDALGNKNSINTALLPDGFYFIRVENGKYCQTKSFVILH